MYRKEDTLKTVSDGTNTLSYYYDPEGVNYKLCLAELKFLKEYGIFKDKIIQLLDFDFGHKFDPMTLNCSCGLSDLDYRSMNLKSFKYGINNTITRYNYTDYICDHWKQNFHV